MDYHRMAELHHTARASAYASANHAKARGHRARAAMHARASRLRFGGPAAGEAANAEALGRSLSCPITLALFVDPVVISTGQTVERKDIERVLRGPESTHKCPVSNVRITRVLVTNWLVRSMVDYFINTYGAREGDEWEGVRALCHPEPEPSSAAAAAAAVGEGTDEDEDEDEDDPTDLHVTDFTARHVGNLLAHLVNYFEIRSSYANMLNQSCNGPDKLDGRKLWELMASSDALQRELQRRGLREGDARDLAVEVTTRARVDGRPTESWFYEEFGFVRRE
jgi:hypothetical protein